MSTLKKTGYLTAIVLVVLAGALYRSHTRTLPAATKPATQAPGAPGNAAAVADTSLYSKGYIDYIKPCKITETRERNIEFTVPEKLPWIGGENLFRFRYTFTVEKDGESNFCQYVGGDSSCSYHPCRLKKKTES